MPASTQLRRAERRAVFGALAAELGHDLQGPLNLLRMTRARLAKGLPLDADELAALGEEIERLAEMSVRLRALGQGVSRRETTSASSIAEQALAVRDHHDVVLEVPAEAELTCDAVLVGLALAELVDNAIEARRQLAGLRYVAGARTGFCVWDDGPGFSLDTDAALGWGASSRPEAAGMGLALVLRVARAHGYRLEVLRSAERTEVWLLDPRSAERA